MTVLCEDKARVEKHNRKNVIQRLCFVFCYVLHKKRETIHFALGSFIVQSRDCLEVEG